VSKNPRIESFFDEATYTVTHVVAEPYGLNCAIIDSVLDYDPKSGRSKTESADRIVSFVERRNLKVEWILETHAHADHMTAAPYLQNKLGGRTGIGTSITEVQATFGKLFNVDSDFKTDGSQFDHLIDDGEVLRVGELEIRALSTPGHTPACLTYVVGDAAFVGDTLFMPDYGTARADFPGGDAATLYRSIHKILALPESTRLFMCHDYKAPGRTQFAWETTVADQKQLNVHVGSNTEESYFVEMRNKRDKTLSTPMLMLPAVQVNMRAGKFPRPESNDVSYLKIPINVI